MPKGQPTPNYKFRLLCRACNSYLQTFVEVTEHGELLLTCINCGIEARSISEERALRGE